MNKGWLELESDPGLFTLLLEDFGVNGVQVEEIYDLQKPIEGPVYGFIFLFRWIEERRSRRKTTEVENFVTDMEAVNNIFFAQQIIPNSCATHALLSVLLNCDNKVKLGKTLNLIKEFTESMSPEDKGYAIANMPELARVHNSFARPETSKPVPEKQSGLSSVRAMDSETFHYVSYVPIHGHLFELDGLKPHPIDHGPWEKGEDWTEKFRKVISDRLGTGGEPYHDIRFNLMAVVPDRRQLLEQKLATLKINFKIVREALQQVVSPTNSEKSDSDSRSQSNETKKRVTFTTAAPLVAPAPLITISTPTVSKPAVVLTSQISTFESVSTISSGLVVSNTSQPSSILKTATSTAVSLLASCASTTISTDVQTIKSATENNITNHCDLMRLRSSTILSAKPNSFTPSEPTPESSQSDFLSKSNSLAELSSIGLSSDSKCADIHIKEEPSKNEECVSIKQGAMDTNESNNQHETKPVVKVEICQTSESKITLHGTAVYGSSLADVTKPLSIETKFNTSPCAASSESTDTASEIGSGFSSPGSLNTSSCQSSPQFSDGNTTADGKIYCCEDGHSHKRKRRSSHTFTPKDLLDLLKNVENEIAICEGNLKEENEKRKKYKIDACRRTHNYDQFIVTFLKMLAEQGLLGDLMEENMTIKKPGGNAATGPKIAKKTLLKVSEKKKKARIKKRGKK
uniref:Ubiquitin carboxyl-terminal hydrolase n=1 Tax=Arion vulgaris TaxID=1028688 RepID=A0A0B7A293_9EUPU